MKTARLTTDRRHIRGEESRRSIVEAAIDSIARRGLSATTVETVAERANVSRSLVLFHFKSKNGLHIEVLNLLGARFIDGWDAILVEPGMSARDRLLALLEYDVRFVIEHPKSVAVWHAFWGEARGSNLYREMSFPRDRRYMEDVRTLLQAMADQGGDDTVDIAVLIKGLEAMLFGLWWQAHIDLRSDHDVTGMRAIRCYLAAAWPRHFAAD